MSAADLTHAANLFAGTIAAAGLTPPAEIVADGEIHRFSANGRRGDDAGWYVLHLDAVPAGAFGNWRDGYSQCWSARNERTMTAIERKALAWRIEAMRRQRDAEQRHRQHDAAAAAINRWNAAAPATVATNHPYLRAKGVKPRGVRIEANHTLLIPMRDTEGRMHSLQSIAPDGAKRFMPGGRVRGCYHAICEPSGGARDCPGDKLVICEGYATGATIHETTGHAVAVAFNAGNLLAVAQALRIKYPSIALVLAADDDWKTPGNPGLTAATKAARAVGGLLAVPKFDGLPRDDKATDFNDLHRLTKPMEGRAR